MLAYRDVSDKKAAMMDREREQSSSTAAAATRRDSAPFFERSRVDDFASHAIFKPMLARTTRTVSLSLSLCRKFIGLFAAARIIIRAAAEFLPMLHSALRGIIF